MAKQARVAQNQPPPCHATTVRTVVRGVGGGLYSPVLNMSTGALSGGIVGNQRALLHVTRRANVAPGG